MSIRRILNTVTAIVFIYFLYMFLWLVIFFIQYS